MNLKFVYRYYHVSPPSFVEKETIEYTNIFGRKKTKTVTNIEKEYERTTIRFDSQTGDPYTLFEVWKPCGCSDGPCEMGLMNKFEVGIISK